MKKKKKAQKVHVRIAAAAAQQKVLIELGLFVAEMHAHFAPIKVAHLLQHAHANVVVHKLRQREEELTLLLLLEV